MSRSIYKWKHIPMKIITLCWMLWTIYFIKTKRLIVWKPILCCFFPGVFICFYFEALYNYALHWYGCTPHWFKIFMMFFIKCCHHNNKYVLKKKTIKRISCQIWKSLSCILCVVILFFFNFESLYKYILYDFDVHRIDLT